MNEIASVVEKSESSLRSVSPFDPLIRCLNNHIQKKKFSQNDLTFIKENYKKSQREEDAQTQY